MLLFNVVLQCQPFSNCTEVGWAVCLAETNRSLPSAVYHGDDVGRMLGSQVMYHQ